MKLKLFRALSQLDATDRTLIYCLLSGILSRNFIRIRKKNSTVAGEAVEPERNANCHSRDSLAKAAGVVASLLFTGLTQKLSEGAQNLAYNGRTQLGIHSRTRKASRNVHGPADIRATGLLYFRVQLNRPRSYCSLELSWLS